MNQNQTMAIAEYLDNAMLERKEVDRITLTHPNLSLEDAYHIQAHGIQRRVGRGEKVIGFKMGLTSRAKREQMNLNSPIFGVLTNQMELQDKGLFQLEKSIHPKIEAEIAFILGKDVTAPLTESQAYEACSGVCAAMEILDSRFVGFKYFSLPDVVADNCSSSYFVLSGEIISIHKVDLSHLLMSFYKDGQSIQQAYSNEISQHPIQSLIQLSEMALKQGINLPRGSVILAGAATQAIALTSGSSFSLDVESLGTVSISVK